MGIEDKLRQKVEEAKKDLEEYLRAIGKARVELETLYEVKERVKNKKHAPKYATGIEWFDEKMNGGFEEGSFVNIAGANFSGKTLFVMKILENISKYKPVLFFSYEMYENLLVRNRCKNYDETQLRNTYIEQNRNDLDVIVEIIKSKAKDGVKFIAIDSRMKIKVAGNKEEWQKNSHISSTLSKLTQELGVIIMLINQISEADLKSKRPSLKGSGDQAYDSDVILYILKDPKDKAKRIMMCEKDRINERTWVKEYTLADLNNHSEYKEIEFISNLEA